MQQISSPLPTGGFRQSSPAIRAAEHLASAARHHDPQLRYRALNLVKRVRSHLGLSAELIEHLDYLVAHTNDTAWEAQRPIVYKDQQTQAYNLGISDRQIRNREKRLMELGFISFEDSANHRRYAVGGDGRDHPDLAFGINLMPLLGRLEELEALAEAVEAETRAWQQARKIYAAKRRKATALINELAAGGEIEDVSELAERLQNLPYVRPSTHLSAIQRLVLRVDEIIDKAGALLEAANPQVSCELTVDTSSREEMDFLHIHYTKNLLYRESCNPPGDKSERGSLRSQVDPEASACAPARDETTGQGVEDRAGSPPVKINPAASSTGAEHVTPEMVCAAAGPVFRSLVEGDTASLSVVAVIGIADQIRPEIGISPHAWADAREIMGDWAAALCVVLAEVRARNPGGYLREMTARARSGDLHLHKSFFGILTGTRSVQ